RAARRPGRPLRERAHRRDGFDDGFDDDRRWQAGADARRRALRLPRGAARSAGDMSDPVAHAPFQFIGCVELRQVLVHRATDERELLERLEDAPGGSVFYHTHGYFLRHRPITTAYGNDFAAWVAVHVRDQVLAERLAVINPFESATLEDLREELV